jgi:hypothetical protein
MSDIFAAVEQLLSILKPRSQGRGFFTSKIKVQNAKLMSSPNGETFIFLKGD